MIRKEERKQEVTILNNKNEYSRCVLPQMEITIGRRKVTEVITKEVQTSAKRR